MRRLPPLNSLRAFEAAARLETFSRAASELCVTHGAVSKQIQLLEGWLEVRLFKRSTIGVTLTRAGERYFREIEAALNRITSATASLTQRSQPAHLNITAPPTFAAKWLMPRLSRFSVACPTVEIRVNTKRDSVATCLRSSDIVIRRGPDRWKALESRLFLQESITPVCQTGLLRSKGAKRLSELSQHAWLHTDARSNDWKTWLKAAGIPGMQPPRSLYFDHSSLTIEAAIDGMGIGMAPISMVRQELQTGLLMTPFPGLVTPTPGYYAIYSRKRQADQGIIEFCSWLEREGMATRRKSVAAATLRRR